MNQSLSQKIQSALINYNIKATDQQIRLLTQYCELLSKWNKAYNLTAIRDINQMVSHHMIDSLTLLPFLTKNTDLKILDVGTGPGLPGIPLAIMRPDCQFYLLDSNGKKTRFLNQAKFDLKLPNIHILNERIEAYKPDFEFDIICSRAFASLKDFVDITKPLQHSKITLLAMKSVKAKIEIAEAALNHWHTEETLIEIQNIDGQRTIIQLTPN